MHSIIQDRREELIRICSRYAVRKLELFGSATTDRFDPEASDLDFLVEFEPGRLQDMADRYFGLLEDLEALFGRKVDLVMASAIKNPYFLQAIEDSRTLLYAA